MIFGSLLGLPFGLSEFLYVPEYWNPPSLFNLIEKIGFGIESLSFGFFVAGICSVIYEVIDRKKTVKIKSSHKSHIVPYVIIIFMYIILEFVFSTKTIYNLIIALLIGAIIIAFRRKDLIMQIITSGIIFAFLYFFLFTIFNKLFPAFVSLIYSLENFWGISILEVPLEEIVFAFSVGACWSTLFEYIRGYRTRSLI